MMSTVKSAVTRSIISKVVEPNELGKLIPETWFSECDIASTFFLLNIISSILDFTYIHGDTPLNYGQGKRTL